MAIFRWQGVGPRGETVQGEMEASSAEAVMARLRTQRIRPLPDRIQEKGKGFNREIKLPSFGSGVKPKDVVIFTRQLATMIDAGLPIVQALEILGQQTPNPTFAKAIKKIKQDVEGGDTFSTALSKHPKIFDNLYTNMVSAGEIGGILDTILNRLSAYMEKALKLKSKIKGAMIYPISIVTVAVGVTAVLLIYVIPVFADLFSSFGKALPLPTQIAINLSYVTIAYLKHIIAAIIGIIFGVRTFYRTEKGRLAIDGMLLKLPIFGDLIRKAAVARFTRTLSTLLSSGVPVLDALYITGKTAGNKVVEQAVLASRQTISQGKTLVEPLTESGVFPPMVCQMINVGETTGALDAMLSKIADFYDDEVDNAVANLTSLMEPLVIVFLGVVIGGLVIAMYMPIFKLGSVVNG
ncbi:MAG TPA: type II secretion system F family protein [Methylomirabilota bacterium]|nr:type II secretion system F family protein [Methylomirabilota bacterium]